MREFRILLAAALTGVTTITCAPLPPETVCPDAAGAIAGSNPDYLSTVLLGDEKLATTRVYLKWGKQNPSQGIVTLAVEPGKFWDIANRPISSRIEESNLALGLTISGDDPSVTKAIGSLSTNNERSRLEKKVGFWVPANATDPNRCNVFQLSWNGMEWDPEGLINGKPQRLEYANEFH